MKQPLKILVVDDSRVIRQSIRKELEPGGYEVSEAKNGLEALTRLAGSSPPDLVTLDIEMPKLNGFDTCRKLRTDRYTRFFTHCSGNRMPVIFVTGNDTMKDRKRGFQLGAVDFITK
ncbi:MAG: response regulator, partial [Deltaproteobacteria bacterium]|nr:response regulator [Deltaproteobacteria bacterium]